MTDIFAYAFMRNAYAACTIVAILCGTIGYLLVLRGEIFAGHALSHIAFPGATGAVLLGLSPLAGAAVFTVAAGLAIGALGARAQRDMTIGVVLTLALGLGILFLHFYTAYAGMATALLFGNVLSVDGTTVAVLAMLAIVCLLALAVMFRPLLLASLQPEFAEARGVPVRVLAAGFMAIAAIAITEATQIVGILLVFALLVAPAAAAVELTRSIRTGMLAATGLALAIVWTSLALAFYTDAPTSFWITALGTAAFAASTAWRRLRRARAPG